MYLCVLVCRFGIKYIREYLNYKYKYNSTCKIQIQMRFFFIVFEIQIQNASNVSNMTTNTFTSYIIFHGSQYIDFL